MNTKKFVFLCFFLIVTILKIKVDYNPYLISSYPYSVLLRWSSVPGSYYHINWSTDLKQWYTVGNYAGNPLIIPASSEGGTTEWIFPQPATTGSIFYRVSVVPQ